MQPQFEVVKGTIKRTSRMPQQSQLLLKALLGLEEEVSIRFKCIHCDEAFRTSKALMRFIYDARKSGKLSEKFSVHRYKIEERKGDAWFVSVARKPN